MTDKLDRMAWAVGGSHDHREVECKQLTGRIHIEVDGTVRTQAKGFTYELGM